MAFLVLSLALILSTPIALAVEVKDYAVQVSTIVQKTPPQIKLVWPKDSDATGYTIYRKAFNATTWGTPIASITPTSVPAARDATSYPDDDVDIGSSYEYRVSKTAFEDLPGTANDTSYTGHGYVYAGIEAPLTENRGKLVLIVDDTYAAELAAELTRLEQDMVGDGWQVLRHDVERDASVPSVKALIQADYDADTANVKAVFLFGHVPVPYSGNLAPDGHTGFFDSHRGAWPADVYYGDIAGTGWVDTTGVNTDTNPCPANDTQHQFCPPVRPSNRNIAGDGKFNPSVIPSDVELQVGRVDLSDMGVFPKNELELLRQYLDKDHAFRHRLPPFFDTVQERGLIDNKFGPSVSGAMATSGWRNFASFFGAGNIDNDDNFDTSVTFDWFPRLRNNSYLWAYGAAGGSYTSAGNAINNGVRNDSQTGIGETGPGITPNPPCCPKILPPLYNFVETDAQVVFTMLFGSYFGDWDSTNNFLRAPLATSFGLTSAWAGRPHWFFHHMALGETIGYSTRLTQNNNNTLYTNQVNSSTRGVHVALMGDPTLRMHTVSPGQDLIGAVTASSVELLWTASADSGVNYHVYRADAPEGPFNRLTSLGSPLTGTSYTDSGVLPGSYTYMVRAVKLENSASGSYFNLSQGIFETVTVASAPSQLQFSVGAYIVNEGSASATVTVTRSGSTAGSASVTYNTANDTALAGADYTATTGTLNFVAGDTSKTFSVPVREDTLIEFNEAARLTLSAPTGGATLGTRASAALVINDNEPTQIRFSAATYSVTEGTPSAAIRVVRIGSLSSASSVNYVTSNGSASAASDYTATSGTLIFPSNHNLNSLTFTVSIINDAVVESPETVNLALSNPSGAVLVAPSTASLSITSDE